MLHQLHHAGQREQLARIEQRLQAAPFHQFHGDVEQAFFFACVINHNDIRMGQQTRGARLGLESPHQFLARHSRPCFGQVHGFDGDASADHRIVRVIHHTHCAAT